MGYLTSHTLKCRPVPELADPEMAIADLRRHSEYARHCLAEDGSRREPGGWPGQEECLREHSKRYPLFGLRAARRGRRGRYLGRVLRQRQDAPGRGGDSGR